MVHVRYTGSRADNKGSDKDIQGASANQVQLAPQHVQELKKFDAYLSTQLQFGSWIDARRAATSKQSFYFVARREKFSEEDN